MVSEKTLESPLDCKEIQPVHPKRNQSLIFIGRTDPEAEIPIFWPPDAKNWVIGKDPDAGKDWRLGKRTTEDEMVGWHHGLDGHEFEQALGVGDGQGGLACCGSWGCNKSALTERLNWPELIPTERSAYDKRVAWWIFKSEFRSISGIVVGNSELPLEPLLATTPTVSSILECDYLTFCS